MITTEIKATLTTLGTKFSVKFDMDITDHMAREIAFAIATLFNDQPAEGEVTRTIKDKNSLSRKAKDDQGDLFKDKFDSATQFEEPQAKALPMQEQAAIEYTPFDSEEPAESQEDEGDTNGL